MENSRISRLARILLSMGPSRRDFIKTGIGVATGTGPLVNAILQGLISPQLSLVSKAEKMGSLSSTMFTQKSSNSPSISPSWAITMNEQDQLVLALQNFEGRKAKLVELAPDSKGNLQVVGGDSPDLADSVVGTSVDNLDKVLPTWLTNKFKETLLKTEGFAPEVIARTPSSPKVLEQLLTKFGYSPIQHVDEFFDEDNFLLQTSEQFLEAYEETKKRMEESLRQQVLKNQQEEEVWRKQQETQQKSQESPGQKENIPTQNQRSLHLTDHYNDDLNETHGPLFWEPGSRPSTWSSRK
jgi:hypothetical protein